MSTAIALRKATRAVRGEKFALLLLHTHVSDAVTEKLARSTFSIGPPSDFKLQDDWAKWLGTIRVEQLSECNLAIEAVLPSETPSVLDHESQEVARIANHAFFGLLLAKCFVAFSPPQMLIGYRTSDDSQIRQAKTLMCPVDEPAELASGLEPCHLIHASDLAEELLGQAPNRLWRLDRSLGLYHQARCEQDGLERLHHYVRTLEGITKPPHQGGTGANFARRMKELASTEDDALFKRIYDRRGAVEHLREHEILSDRTRDCRIGLRRDEHLVEYLARSILARIVSRDDLRRQFGTADAVDAFWGFPPEQRRSIWGKPIVAERGLDGFCPDMLSDLELGLET